MKEKCPYCNGSGVFQEYDEFDRYHALECSQCNGSGVINTEELKPCPFCGAKAEVHDCGEFDNESLNVTYSGKSGVHCTECSIATLPYDNEQEAIEAWNRRAEQ